MDTGRFSVNDKGYFISLYDIDGWVDGERERSNLIFISFLADVRDCYQRTHRKGVAYKEIRKLYLVTPHFHAASKRQPFVAL